MKQATPIRQSKIGVSGCRVARTVPSTSSVGLTRTAAMFAGSECADKLNVSIKRNMHITNQLGVRRWAI